MDDVDEVVMQLHRVVRREEPDEHVVVLKDEEQSAENGTRSVSKHENVRIIQTKTRVTDANKAADILLRHYDRIKDRSAVEEKVSGVVILPEVDI